GAQGPARLELRLDDVFRVADVEVVLLAGAQAVAGAQERRRLLARELHGILGDGRAEDVVQPGGAPDLLLRRGGEPDDGVVLVLPGDGAAFRLERGDHLARKVLDPNHLPDRVLRAEELVADGPPEGADPRRPLYVRLGEDRAPLHDPAADFEILRRDAPERRV